MCKCFLAKERREDPVKLEIYVRGGKRLLPLAYGFGWGSKGAKLDPFILSAGEQ